MQRRYLAQHIDLHKDKKDKTDNIFYKQAH